MSQDVNKIVSQGINTIHFLKMPSLNESIYVFFSNVIQIACLDTINDTCILALLGKLPHKYSKLTKLTEVKQLEN